jgi:hypothetical protein
MTSSSTTGDLVVLDDHVLLSVAPRLASKSLLLFHRMKVKASKGSIFEDSLLGGVEPGWICILRHRTIDM